MEANRGRGRRQRTQHQKQEKEESYSASIFLGGCGNMGISDVRLNPKRVRSFCCSGHRDLWPSECLITGTSPYHLPGPDLSRSPPARKRLPIRSSRGCVPIAVKSRTREQDRASRAQPLSWEGCPVGFQTMDFAYTLGRAHTLSGLLTFPSLPCQ